MKTNDLNAEYWEHRYMNKKTGWDIGYISTPLKSYIDQLKHKQIKILIPGVGNGYEVDYLWKKGFKNVYVADVAKTPLQNLQKRLSDFPSNHLLHTNFFELNSTYDLIIEQTFFCALDPKLRPNYVEKMHSLLNTGGKLSGLLFNFPLSPSGPPFGGDITEYKQLFNSRFKLNTLEPAINSINERQGKELFFIFEKK